MLSTKISGKKAGEARYRGRRPSAFFVAFLAEARGATAVEFALIAPMLLLTIIFLMSVGYMVLMNQLLDYATQKASRLLRTGHVQTAGTTQTNFRTNTLCPLLPSMFNCANVIVNIQKVPTNDLNYPNEYYNFVNAAKTALIVPPLDNTQTNYYMGGAQCFVYVQVLYPVSFLMSMLSSSAIATTYNGQSVYLIMSTSTFLTEPYSASASSC